METTGHIVLQHDGAWVTFRRPVKVLATAQPEDVLRVLEEVEEQVQAGKFAAGYLSYEAAVAFDHHLENHPPSETPLAWFGIYEAAEEGIHAPEYSDDTFSVSDWTSQMDEDAFVQAIERIKDYIASGDTYQVNFTFPFTATFSGNAWQLFEQLTSMQTGKHAAYIDTGNEILCSASPELFYQREKHTLTCRPMKGTRKRGLTFEQDEALYYQLEHAPKDQSENIMIVDMIRNDLGKIAEPGSIQTTRVFDVEKYETVFQMISEVQASSTANLVDTFRALFPCASITGAPKVRTMQIIRELETGPRGIYTGCIGSIFPDQRASFNVAIRTVQIDRARGEARYHTGAGIVWDSDPRNEYQECLTKTEVLTSCRPEFELLETVLWEPELGYFVLPHHYRRLSRSAKYFGFNLQLNEMDQELKQLTRGLPSELHRMRITVKKDGSYHIDPQVISGTHYHFKITLDSQATDSNNVFLYHKTTHRSLYTAARDRHPDHDDVLLWNAKEQLTESTIANLVLRFGEDYYTPPVSCGLLNGAFRQSLIDMETLKEKVLYKSDLEKADEILLINSVRKWISVSL